MNLLERVALRRFSPHVSQHKALLPTGLWVSRNSVALLCPAHLNLVVGQGLWGQGWRLEDGLRAEWSRP